MLMRLCATFSFIDSSRAFKWRMMKVCLLFSSPAWPRHTHAFSFVYFLSGDSVYLLIFYLHITARAPAAITGYTRIVTAES